MYMRRRENAPAILRHRHVIVTFLILAVKLMAAIQQSDMFRINLKYGRRSVSKHSSQMFWQ